MPLAMARPWKHPKTGIYWLRKRVPEDLIPLVGKREEKRSLGTRDPLEAKRKHAAALNEIEIRWSNLKKPPTSLSEREAFELAAPVGDWWIAQHIENPSGQNFWKVELGEALFEHPPAIGPKDFESSAWLTQIRGFDFFAMESWCIQRASELSHIRGLRLDEADNRMLARCIARVMQRSSQQLERFARGEPSEMAMMFEPAGRAIAVSAKQEPLPFSRLVQGWIAERRPASKTVYEWQRVINQLVSFLGEDNARSLSAENLLSWKSSMVDAGLRPKTVRDAKLAPVRAILQWGVNNQLLTANVAEKVTLNVRDKQSEKKRSFTDEEARTVLRAALMEKDIVRRWVPWIGAYTGARVSEICQLRREDIIEIESVWCIKVVPEAGSVKTSGSERIIPIHPALVVNGFLDFVLRRPVGPIFADLSPDKFGKRGGNGTKMIGRFVRGLGIRDTRISPNHSWRHRIKTLGRRHGLGSGLNCTNR